LTKAIFDESSLAKFSSFLNSLLKIVSYKLDHLILGLGATVRCTSRKATQSNCHEIRKRQALSYKLDYPHTIR
jgi:hypothetical protein